MWCLCVVWNCTVPRVCFGIFIFIFCGLRLRWRSYDTWLRVRVRLDDGLCKPWSCRGSTTKLSAYQNQSHLADLKRTEPICAFKLRGNGTFDSCFNICFVCALFVKLLFIFIFFIIFNYDCSWFLSYHFILVSLRGNQFDLM